MNSLYLRLNLAAILVVCVFLATTAAVLDNAYSESTQRALQERMMGLIYQLLTAAKVDDQGRLLMPLPTDLPVPQLALPNSGWYSFVSRNGEAKPLWHSPSLLNLPAPKAFPLQVGQTRWQAVQLADGKTYYLLGFGFQRTVKSGVFPFNFYLLTELAPLHRAILAFRQRLWGGLAAAAILLFAVQIGLLHWGLRPLRQVGLELSVIETGAVSQITGHYPHEIKNVTSHINRLLTQERARQARYRNALADLAHSLKTPLAVLLSATDCLAELPQTVQEQGTRMLGIVERQLQRAGACASDTLPRVAIAQTADRVVSSLSKVYQWKNIAIHQAIDPNLHVRCDEADLIELLGNLLDNAYKWGRGHIRIQSQKQGPKIILSIQDDGPGIPPEQRAYILLRGGRADESMPGHGIGLSIVAEIVDAYQGRLSIGSSDLGGAEVVLEFWNH